MENDGKCRALPQDILIGIFLLLPMQAIFRCKVVSKEWKNLINDPTFTSLYRNKSMGFVLSKDKLHCLFLSDNVENTSFKVSSGVPITLSKCLYCPPKLLLDTNKLVACVLTVDAHFIYYNLVSGDSYEVRDAPLRRNYHCWFACGLGYDPRDHDYKIVVVGKNEGFDLSSINKWDDRMATLLVVYNFRNRGWKPFQCGFEHEKYRRQISADPYTRRQFFESSYSLNGVLYWALLIKDESKPIHQHNQVVVALNLHSYEFVEMALPTNDYDQIYTLPNATLTELDGQLCFWIQTRFGFDVWVMKESWTKLLRIHPWQMSVPYDLKSRLTATIVGTTIVVYAYGEYIQLLFRYNLDEDEVDDAFPKNRDNEGILRSLKSSFKKALFFFFIFCACLVSVFFLFY